MAHQARGAGPTPGAVAAPRTPEDVLDRIDRDHTYYAVNLEGLGVVHRGIVHGAGDIDLAAVGGEQLGRIELPDGADQALASLRLIQRRAALGSTGAKIRSMLRCWRRSRR
jgi:hypothetical protein